MLKNQLLEIVESFLQENENDKLLLESTQHSITKLFAQYIPSKEFEDYTLVELQSKKSKLINGLENKILDNEIIREAINKQLEKINKRIEDLTI
jgi:hypothetical protein